MNSDSSIDPHLRDTAQTYEGTNQHSVNPPPIAYPVALQDERHDHQQHQHHPPQYAPYPQDATYNHSYYGPPTGHHYAQDGSPNGFQALPPPRVPGPHYVSSRVRDAKRLRACEACRGLKVRCEPDPEGGACKRCLKAGRKCEITPPSRKRQKKTDSRVSELEKQLADIQFQLKLTALPGSDSDGERYGDGSSIQFVTPQRQIGQQPAYSQRHNAGKVVESHEELPYGSSQMVGHKRLYSEMGQHGPMEAHIYGLPQPPPPHPDSILLSVRAVADSMDTKLATSLFIEYLKTLVPQKPTLNNGLTSKLEPLRRSKPVLFMAIMTLMLQTRCLRDGKDAAIETLGGATHEEIAEKGNQALHLLSEVAMGDSAGQGRNGGAEGSMHIVQKNPANAFVQRLLRFDEGELNNETWLEYLLRDFY